MPTVTTKVFTRVSAPGAVEEKALEIQADLNTFLSVIPYNNVLDIRYATVQMAPAQTLQEAIVLYLV